MLHDFPHPENLPGRPTLGPPTALSSYLNLNRVAAKLVEDCIDEKGEAGWRPTGQHLGIGVFVWSTDSEQDREIEDEQPDAASSYLRAVANGSTEIA